LSKLSKLLFSYWTTFTLLTILAVGAAVATFIENDYGSSTSRILVYSAFWYELVLTLTIINMIGIMSKTKMFKHKAKIIFHGSFVFILIGAALTRYEGYEGIMHINEGESTNKMISLEPYIQVTINDNGKITTQNFLKDFAATDGAVSDMKNNFNYSVDFGDKTFDLNFLHYKFVKNGNASQGLLTVEGTIDGETQSTRLVGQRAQKSGVVKTLRYNNGISVSLEYGSKNMTIPFEVRLNDFKLDRYPGSMAPSSYSSQVTLIDKANNVEFDFHIYMNNILNYSGFKFFQSSYDPDEKGTVLSVNHDIGHLPTYFGYFLLTLGLIMNFFDTKSRFSKLTKYISKMNSAAIMMIALTFGYTTSAYSATSETVKYLEDYKTQSVEIADKFSHLVVQANMGTMKPIDSLATDILNKLTRKSSFLGMNANQVVLGMLSRPDIWKDIKMLKIKTPKLKKFLGISESRKYVAFSEVLGPKEYKLRNILEEVNKMDPNSRGTFEKDVIRLDERVNIVYMVFYSDIFKIYPKIKDENNQWLSPMAAMKTLTGKDQEIVKFITTSFLGGVADGDYEKALKGLELIATYQRKLGAAIIPSVEKVNAEITFNKLDIFPRLTLAYLFLGILMFIISFLTVFNEKWSSKTFNSILFGILAVLFIIQTTGMGIRWYISGHAPWSNTYESLVYIAWSTMFAGVVFFRKSLLALSATTVMAAVFMFTAHLSGIDPQITNLVPVLKSYWLTIHVAIITGSYGFLGLGAMLGFMALILFIFRTDAKPNIDKTIKHITAINEAALIIGLAALVVGNFLGGVWANESWGRYWGWDPKETWAYVAIVTYILVLHLRLVPKLNKPFVFAVASTLAFSTILMTYFGVNFYLSGMHSYATGDPVPVPTWVYVLTAMVFVIIGLASRKRDLGVIKV